MDIFTINLVREELLPLVIGRRFGKVFQLSRFEFAIDFRLADPRFLFISIEPARPRVYLIRRRLRDLEKRSVGPSTFAVSLRKLLSGAVIESIEQVKNDRILIFELKNTDEFGEQRNYSLVVQMTGKSADLLLLNSHGRIIDSARGRSLEDQTLGELYHPPERPSDAGNLAKPLQFKGESKSISEKLDEYYTELDAAARFRSLANAASSKFAKEFAKRRRLLARLDDDLAGHGEAEKWKRFGDLLLANAATARRDGTDLIVTDYFDEKLPAIAIPAALEQSPTEAAENYFRKYTKARNAAAEIADRRTTTIAEIDKLERERGRLNEAIDAGDEEYVAAAATSGERSKAKKVRVQKDGASGTRSFVSSDGFEILVGKKAKDNDFLTFRVAKSLDLWMHAADYPGSHVVIKNPNRKEIPPTTLREAAQLAAFYSQGRAQVKAAVHYTQKKFVNKPKGSAPGLVSLASFKTILVEPNFPAVKQKES